MEHPKTLGHRYVVFGLVSRNCMLLHIDQRSFLSDVGLFLGGFIRAQFD